MLEISAPDALGEVAPGQDLAELLLQHVPLRDGDVVVIASKVVSKAEGRLKSGPSTESLEAETERVVARKGTIRIVRGRLGITQAMAGLDGSNVPVGNHLLLPLDPDASARRIRGALRERAGVNVGVLISDTAGRAWRLGQTELAIGAAGVRLIDDFAGREDGYGNHLVVTQTCLADEICSAAELAQGKLGRRPIAIVRGLNAVVLSVGDDGAGAASLNRDAREDLFGFGSREAVLRAILRRAEDAAGFGAPASAAEILDLISEVLDGVSTHSDAAEDELRLTVDKGHCDLVLALAFAHGWQSVEAPGGTKESRQLRLVRVSP